MFTTADEKIKNNSGGDVLFKQIAVLFLNWVFSILNLADLDNFGGGFANKYIKIKDATKSTINNNIIVHFNFENIWIE